MITRYMRDLERRDLYERSPRTTIRDGQALHVEFGPLAPAIVVTGLPPCKAELIQTAVQVEIRITLEDEHG